MRKNSAAPTSTIYRGEVVWFDDGKGFGFIRPEDGSADIFVHYSGIAGAGRRKLLGAQQVTYTVAEGNKGPMAVNVEVVQP